MNNYGLAVLVVAIGWALISTFIVHIYAQKLMKAEEKNVDSEIEKNTKGLSDAELDALLSNELSPDPSQKK